MIPQIKELYKKDESAVKRVPELKIVVLISENDELTKKACNEAGIFSFVKPKLGNEDALRQLLNPEPAPVPAKTVNTQAQETTEDNQ